MKIKKNKKLIETQKYYEKVIEDYEQYIEELMGAYNNIEDNMYIWKAVAHIYMRLYKEKRKKK